MVSLVLVALQREKRPYKRRKHRHPTVGSTQGLRGESIANGARYPDVRVIYCEIRVIFDQNWEIFEYTSIFIFWNWVV